MKKFVKLLACVLALTLVVAFAINASNAAKPLKRLTQKKVPNPENVLQSADIIWSSYITKDGITYERNQDGSWHIYGTSTKDTNVQLTLSSIPLEAGKKYMLSSGSERAGVRSFCLAVKASDGSLCVGDMNPESGVMAGQFKYGAFIADGNACYLKFYIWNSGAVIDETIYPCLVEGTEPGDFYIYK